MRQAGRSEQGWLQIVVAPLIPSWGGAGRVQRRLPLSVPWRERALPWTPGLPAAGFT